MIEERDNMKSDKCFLFNNHWSPVIPVKHKIDAFLWEREEKKNGKVKIIM